jgi:translocation and assembly module TamB
MKRILIAFAVLLALVVGAFAGSILWLRSDGGRAWLVREIEVAASTPGEAELSIGALTGDPFGAFRANGIRVRDRAGVWLTIESAAIDWRPLDLLGGTVTITRAEIRTASLARLPESDPSAPSTSLAEQLETLRGLPSIRVRALKVEDLALGQPVLGEAATIRIAGGVNSTAAESVQGRIDVTRVDGHAGSLQAMGRYALANDALDFALTASEPAGGLLARALDIPGLPLFQATAKGAGPLAEWKGHAALSFERTAAGEADVVIRHATATAFEVTGTATVPAKDTSLPRRLISGNHEFHIAGTLGTDAVLALSEARWTLPTASLDASGRLDLDNLALDGKATLRKTDAAVLTLSPSDASLKTLAVQATASGKLPLPAVQATVEAGGVAVPGLATADIAATVSIKPDSAERGRAEGKVTLKSIAWSAPSGATALAGQEATIDFAADLNTARSTVALDRAHLAVAYAALDGSGRFDWKSGDGTLKAALDIPDLSVLRDLAALPLTGRLAASLDGMLKNFGASASATLDGKAEDFATGDAVADAILGRAATIAATLDMAGGKFEAKKVSLASGRIRLTADGSYDPDRNALAGSYALDIEGGPAVALADGVALDCACRLSGTLSGTATDPRVVGDLSTQALRVEDVGLSKLAATYDLAKLADGPTGDVTVKSETPLGDATLRTKVSLGGERLRLTELQAESGDATLRGSLDIPLSGDPVAGELRFEATALNALLAAARLEGEGAAKGQVTLRAAGKRQALDASATVTSLQVRTAPDAPVVSVAKATIAVAAADLLAGDRNKVDLRLEKAEVADASVARLTATAQGGVDKARLSLSAKGDWRGPLALDATADYTAEKARQVLHVATLQGTLLGEKLALRKPLRFTRSGSEIAAEPVDLAYGGATLSGHLRSGEKTADVSLALDGMPLKLIDSFYPLGMNGKADATVAIKGAWPAPDGTLSLSIPKLSVDQAADSPALGVAVNGTLRRGRLALDGKITAGDAAPSVFNASLPLRLEGPKIYVDMPRDQAVSGRLSWLGETAALWRFAPLPEHLMRGEGKIDVTLSGTMAKPDLRGSMTLSDGYYESLEYGTVLRPLDLAIDFDGRRAKITRLSAGDGGTGKLDGKGEIAFDAEAGFPFDLALTLKALTAVRRDDVQASVSGNLSISGSTKKAKLESKLTTDEVEIRVLDRLPPEVATLDVVEIGRFGKDRTRVKPERPVTADIDLAIDVEMPRRVFVRGRGIDSEWKGNLKVTGPASDPRIGGYVTLVRGIITVVGKTFQMESGTVVLPDRANAEPELSLKATYTGRSIAVTANVDGPVSKPTITLSSSPSLPQDEIVSRVLFDKSTSKLSPYEAAQLALAVAELSGKGGAGGIMDLVRKTLGVDVLQVESVETEKGSQPVVGAGKYVTDDVYVGVKQGATPESSSVGVEVELTPHISVGSDVRRDGQSDVGVKFKYDY